MSSHEVRNLFRQAAEIYDATVDFDDLGFYLERAATAGGPILELACGTGRIALPLAEQGHEVWGIDLSREMLAVFEGKLAASDAAVRARVHLLHGDMSAFSLDRSFPLIICPFRAFQALTEPRQQVSCLDCVKDHLAPLGRFIVDVFRPYAQLDQSWVRPESEVGEASDPRTGRRIRRRERRRRIDLERQIIYPELIYYVEREDGSEERCVERLAMAYFYEEQMRALLQDNGFEIVEAMGDFEGGPIEEGPELIYVCTTG